MFIMRIFYLNFKYQVIDNLGYIYDILNLIE